MKGVNIMPSTLCTVVPSTVLVSSWAHALEVSVSTSD